MYVHVESGAHFWYVCVYVLGHLVSKQPHRAVKVNCGCSAPFHDTLCRRSPRVTECTAVPSNQGQPAGSRSLEELDIARTPRPQASVNRSTTEAASVSTLDSDRQTSVVVSARGGDAVYGKNSLSTLPLLARLAGTTIFGKTCMYQIAATRCVGLSLVTCARTLVTLLYVVWCGVVCGYSSGASITM